MIYFLQGFLWVLVIYILVGVLSFFRVGEEYSKVAIKDKTMTLYAKRGDEYEFRIALPLERTTLRENIWQPGKCIVDDATHPKVFYTVQYSCTELNNMKGD